MYREVHLANILPCAPKLVENEKVLLMNDMSIVLKNTEKLQETEILGKQ